MEVNIAGLVVLVQFYLLILVIGIVAARKVKVKGHRDGSIETLLVAGRDLSTVVGVFTMIATTVGGGYINGTAESVATNGLVWTLAPLGIFFGLILGGLIFAQKMRDQRYVTMLDPLQQRFGAIPVFLVYIASLCGDIFWTASILSALGTSLSVIINLDITIAICMSAIVTVFYTMIGQIIAVAYTDIAQLILITFGLVLSVPFVLTNEKVGDITEAVHRSRWLGSMDIKYGGVWVDLLIAMTFGTIPWQAYFQRVLSVRSGRQARLLSIAGAIGAVVLVIPSVLIGAAAVSANWNETSLSVSPSNLQQETMVLPLMLHNFTPKAVSVLGLGAISAAVMSSMDSSILGSSTMFTHNIYRKLIRNKARDWELHVVQRVAVVVVGILATVISLEVQMVYGLFILAADIVFVIVLPQLSCAVFLPRTNGYGAVAGYICGMFLRIGAGENFIGFKPLIHYPFYKSEDGQLFPFRTFSMVCSFVMIIGVSEVSKKIFQFESFANFDVLKAFNKNPNCSTQRREDVANKESSDCQVDQELILVGKNERSESSDHEVPLIPDNCTHLE